MAYLLRFMPFQTVPTFADANFAMRKVETVPTSADFCTDSCKFLIKAGTSVLVTAIATSQNLLARLRQ